MTAIAIKEMRKEVKKYVDLADERMLKAVHAMLGTDLEEAITDEDTSDDWWDEISDAQRASIERGLAQSERGEGIPHEEMVKKYPQWFTK
jgi:predicted transcriptional regulator